MKKTAIALGFGAGLGVAATIATSGPRVDPLMAAETVRGVVGGVLLGARVYPYDWNIPAAEYQQRLGLWSSLCQRPSCDDYGLASANIGD